jgi:hypothetical protein
MTSGPQSDSLPHKGIGDEKAGATGRMPHKAELQARTPVPLQEAWRVE